jgi:hypothetical protein
MSYNQRKSGKNKNNKFPGSPEYPVSEGIYNKGKEETEIDPEDLAAKKHFNEKNAKLNEKSFSEDVSGSDLDIPGAELDDSMEDIVSEDEENNHYSLGEEDNDNDFDGGMLE